MRSLDKKYGNRGNWGRPKGEDQRLAHKPIRNSALDGEPFEKRPHVPPGKKRAAKKPWALQYRLRESAKDRHWAPKKYLESWLKWSTIGRYRKEADAQKALDSFEARDKDRCGWYEYKIVNTEDR